MLISQQRITQALNEHATRHGDDSYSFDGSSTFSEDEARHIIETCVLLDVPITANIAVRAWYKLVRRVVELERALGEHAHEGHVS